MTYSEVFGGTNIYPADVTYLAVALTGNIDFDWPMESAAPPYPLARIVDVMTNGPHLMRLPIATEGSPGAIVLFNCLTASTSPCFVTDYDGNTIATLAPGEQWEIYLTDNTTEAGEWEVFQFGASTATVQPSALAGYGMIVTGSTLSQAVPVTTFTATPRAVIAGDRASALVWTGPGSGVLDLPAVAAVGNNYFVSARNAGGGMLTLEPTGSELIDGSANVALSPGEGVVLVTDGLVWYTLGRGQAAVFAFDYTVVDVSGAVGGTYTLTGSELNRIAYRFTGALATNVVVVVPSTVQQYWVDNATTGAFTLSLNTSGGTPVTVAQGSRGIYYSDGLQVIDADTSGMSLPINASDGGTGQVSYTIGDILTASSVVTLARLAAAPAGNVLTSQGVGVMPAWGAVTGAALGGFTENFAAKGTAGGGLVSSTLISDDGASVKLRGDISTGPVSGVGPHILELGALRTGDGESLIDFHSTAGSDFEARISRWPGINGQFQFMQNGTFPYTFMHGGVERMRLNAAGQLGVGTTNPQAAIHGYAPDGSMALGASGSSKGVRFNGSATRMSIEGVDNSLVTSFQPIALGGSAVVLWTPTHGDRVQVNADGNVVFPGPAFFDAAYVNSIQLRLASNAYIAGDANYVTYQFDAGDYMQHDRGGSVLRFGIASVTRLTVHGSGANVEGNFGATTLYGNAAGLTGSAPINVNYANSAGNADTLDGVHSSFFVTKQTGVWQSSDDGYNRLLWLSGSNSYYKSPLGHIFRRNDDADLFTIDNAGNATAAGNLGAFSDAKLKANLEVIPDALAKVCALTGYTYDRVDIPGSGRQTGLIAQDVQKVLPEAVVDGDTLSLAYGNMVGLLVEAIKTLEARVAELEAGK